MSCIEFKLFLVVDFLLISSPPAGRRSSIALFSSLLTLIFSSFPSNSHNKSSVNCSLSPYSSSIPVLRSKVCPVYTVFLYKIFITVTQRFPRRHLHILQKFSGNSRDEKRNRFLLLFLHRRFISTFAREIEIPEINENSFWSKFVAFFQSQLSLSASCERCSSPRVHARFQLHTRIHLSLGEVAVLRHYYYWLYIVVWAGCQCLWSPLFLSLCLFDMSGCRWPELPMVFSGKILVGWWLRFWLPSLLDHKFLVDNSITGLPAFLEIRFAMQDCTGDLGYTLL